MSYSGRILLIGLPSECVRRPRGPADPHGHKIVKESGIDPEMVAKGLAKIEGDLHGAGYSNFVFMPLAPEEPDWRDRLSAELDNKVDGVCIGFGVRGQAACTEFFEQLVQRAPVFTRVAERADIVAKSPSTKLCFNTSPPSTLQAVQRNFPLSS